VADHPFRTLRKFIDKTLCKLNDLLESMYADGGDSMRKTL
jgi:hypothetical protein